MTTILSTGFGTYGKVSGQQHRMRILSLSVDDACDSVYSAAAPIAETQESPDHMSAVPQYISSVSFATLANALGRSVNVLLPFTVVVLFGASPETDRFFFVLALAFYFYSSLSYAMTEASVPISVRFHRSISSQGVVKIGLCTATGLFAIAYCVTLAESTFSSGYAAAFALMAGAGIANGFATGILHAHARYALPGLSWAVRFIPLIIFVAFSQPDENLHLLAIGIGIADWLRLAVLLLLRPVSAVDHQVCAASTFIKKHLPDIIPLSVAMLIMGLNPIIDRLIANLSGPGSLSILDTGERLYGVLSTLCSLGMMTVLLTRLSQAVLSHTLESEWAGIMKRSIAWCGMWLTVGVLTGYGLFGEWISDSTPLTNLESHTVQMTYWYYLAGLLPFTISIVYIKRLQATRRYWIIAAIALSMVALNLPASLALRAVFGVQGIALATSLLHIAHCIALAACSHFRHPDTNSR